MNNKKSIMKKIISTLICFVLLLLPFTACNDSVTETKIELTKDNCLDYINFNMYITDFENVKFSNKDELYISCVIHIETSKKINCHFENVVITYFVLQTTLWNYNQGTYGTEGTLDYDGRSHVTYCAFKEKPYLLSTNRLLPDLNFNRRMISRIEGYAIVN